MGLAGGQAGLAKAAAACGAGTAMGGHWPEAAAAEELLAEPEPRPVTTMLATCAACATVSFFPDKQALRQSLQNQACLISSDKLGDTRPYMNSTVKNLLPIIMALLRSQL